MDARRRVAVLVMCVSIVVTLPASAGVRHPISTKGLWWGEVQGVAVDAAGEVYVVGTAGSPDRHMVVRRYARGGGLVWERTYSVPGWRFAADARAGVAIDPRGGVYVAGLVHLRSGDVLEFPDVGAFVRAYGPMGALRWQRTVHLRDWQSEIATGVAAGPGFVVMSGYSTCFECTWHEGWVRAWTRNGRPLWTDDFEFAGIPDEKRDEATAVAVDVDGSVYVVGVVDRQEDAYGGEGPLADSEVVVRRMTSGGRVVWTRVLSDVSKDNDRPTDVAVRDGRVAVAALFGAGIGRPHPWLRMYTTSGRGRWTKVWATGVGWEDDPAVAIGRLRRPFVAVPTGDRTRVLALTPAGWLRWTSAIDGDAPVSVAVREPFLRLVEQRPASDRALLVSYRA